MVATFKVLAVWLTLGPVLGLLGIPYTLLVGDVSLLYRCAMWLVRTGIAAAGITTHVQGMEHIPVGRSCIFMCNHVSNLDPPVLLPALPGRSSVMLKKELMSIPILGRAMTLAGFVPVERGSQREAAQKTVGAAAEALSSGLHILVFPEGTRSRDARLATFKKGPFFLAQQTGAPIVPIAIAGTEHMMRKGSIAIEPGRATVQLLPAIEPANYTSREALMAAVHASIANALPAHMKPLGADAAAQREAKPA